MERKLKKFAGSAARQKLWIETLKQEIMSVVIDKFEFHYAKLSHLIVFFGLIRAIKDCAQRKNRKVHEPQKPKSVVQTEICRLLC